MNQFKYILFIMSLGLLLLPIIQKRHSFVEEKPLNGDFSVKKKPFFWRETFESGIYQKELEAHLKDSIGFHNFFIRFNNQLKYSLFNEINSSGVIEGKDDMLIPKSYIESYLGKDFVGEDKLKEFAVKLKHVQDSLEKYQKKFLLLLVPGKASIYPELIPGQYLEERNGKTNYEVLKRFLDKQSVYYIDFRSYLKSKKGNLQSQIYADNSVHWSGNTVSVVSDTLFEYLRDKFGYEMPYIIREKGEYTVENFRYTDYDIAESMNLLWSIAKDTLYYPNLKFYRSSKVKKPTLLGCGDSFFQSFKGFYPILDSGFSKASRLYYYNEFVDWPHRFYGKGLNVNLLDIQLELERSDLVIVEMTDENVKKLGFGFIDDIYEHYLRNVYDWNRVNHLKEDQYVLNKAKSFHQLAGYTEDQMKTAIAKNITKMNWLSPEEIEAKIQEKIIAIKETPEWLEKVKNQAIEKGIPLEQNIRENAEWVVNNE